MAGLRGLWPAPAGRGLAEGRPPAGPQPGPPPPVRPSRHPPRPRRRACVSLHACLPALSPLDRFYLDNSSLVLKGLRASDSGAYTCVAHNAAGEDARLHTVNVLGEQPRARRGRQSSRPRMAAAGPTRGLHWVIWRVQTGP